MAIEHDSDSELARLVRAAGSQSAFGRLVGRRQSTIREWLKVGRVAAEAAPEVARLAGVPVQTLRPDLFGDQTAEAAATSKATGKMEPAR